MTKENLRIVFLGTPEFAVASLDALVSGGYNVVAAVTMPDKQAGRGHKMITSAVKDYALEHGIPLLQPEKLKNEEFLEQLRAYRADLQIVVAFRMLPEVVWAMPRLGTINLHGALLPQYRGAAPINWALINGETTTGVTTFFLKQEIDTGNIILQESIAVGPEETFGEVYERLEVIGAQLVIRTVDLVLQGEVPTTVQDNIDPLTLRPAPKIFKDDCRINFEQDAAAVHNFVRGLSPVPCAWADLMIGGRQYEAVKIFRTRVCDGQPIMPPGTVQVGKHDIRVACSQGWVEILEMQLPGKKKMLAKDLINGLK